MLKIESPSNESPESWKPRYCPDTVVTENGSKQIAQVEKYNGRPNELVPYIYSLSGNSEIHFIEDFEMKNMKISLKIFTISSPVFLHVKQYG